MTRKVTQEDFIGRARVIHGDKYNYDNIGYTNITSPIRFTCLKCGHENLLRQARHHVEGSNQGCEICTSVLRTRNKETFLKKLFYRHKDTEKWDFKDFNYVSNNTKSKVTCLNGHEFMTRPNDLLTGYGCRICGHTKVAAGRKPRPVNKRIITKLLSNNVITDLTDYRIITDRVRSRCLVCDYKWESRAGYLFDNPRCPNCEQAKGHKKLEKRFEDYKEAIKDKFGDKYKYKEETFVNGKTPMTIVCPEHGEFQLSMIRHINKQRPNGCPKCAKYGFKRDREAYLYYLKTGDKYKIGVTNRSVSQRFGLRDREIIDGYICYLMNGEDAIVKEREIIKSNKEYLYTGNDILSSGNTEIFTENVLNIHDSQFLPL